MSSTTSHQNPQPLSGRTVMITRAGTQSDETASLLERLGATVIKLPTIEFTQPIDNGPLDSAINRLSTYDYIVFTSANAVRFFLKRLESIRSDGLADLERLTVAAIGPATARTLSEAGIRVDLIARDSKAEGALRAIRDYLGPAEHCNGLRFLIPRAAVARELLPESLRKLGATVDVVETYRTILPPIGGETIARLFTEQRVDAVTFTSSSTVSNFATLVGARDLSELLNGVIVACIGPITAATAAEHGLRDVIQPATHTSEALVEALVNAAALSKT